MEAAKLGEEIFTEAPHLTAVEKNRQHEGRINLAPEGPLEGKAAKHAPQGSKGRRS